MADKILLRGDSKANWVSVNPVLSNRETVVETDTLKFKIGNGVSTYTQLPYANQKKTFEYYENFNNNWEYQITKDVTMIFSGTSGTLLAPITTQFGDKFYVINQNVSEGIMSHVSITAGYQFLVNGASQSSWFALEPLSSYEFELLYSFNSNYYWSVKKLL